MQKTILPADGTLTQAATSPLSLISNLKAHPADFRLASLHSLVNQFLFSKILFIFREAKGGRKGGRNRGREISMWERYIDGLPLTRSPPGTWPATRHVP